MSDEDFPKELVFANGFVLVTDGVPKVGATGRNGLALGFNLLSGCSSSFGGEVSVTFEVFVSSSESPFMNRESSSSERDRFSTLDESPTKD